MQPEHLYQLGKLLHCACSRSSTMLWLMCRVS